MQNYKIFYNKAVLSITKSDQYSQTLKPYKNCYVFDVSLNLEQIIADFLSDNKHVTILYKDINEENIIWNGIKNFFLFQRAAGGFILKNNAVLSIYRYEHWDFPKGHVEAGETDEEAAMREVTEETGIDNLVIIKDLNYTYHVYPYKEHFVLKQTHWYEMHTACDKTPIPQTEEEIHRVEWIPLQNIDIVLKNTYPALVDLINRGE
jgi:8-oxo-dGTP pyrophosphatase MutT (NUDIX family)